jgi:hypothetical protein
MNEKEGMERETPNIYVMIDGLMTKNACFVVVLFVCVFFGLVV